MADLVYQIIDTFIRCHFSQVVLEREDDASAVSSPKQHAYPIFGPASKPQIPEQHFPVEAQPSIQKAVSNKDRYGFMSRPACKTA